MSTEKAVRPATNPLLLSVEEVALACEPVANDPNVDDNHDDDPSPAGGAMPVPPILKDGSANDNAKPPVLEGDAVPVAANDTSRGAVEPSPLPLVSDSQLEAERDRLVAFLRGEGSELARWLTVRRLHTIHKLLKQESSQDENSHGAKTLLGAFVDALHREINVDVATLYRWKERTDKLVALIGEGAVDDLKSTIVANDVRLLVKLTELKSQDQALSVLREYTHGRGKKAAIELLGKYAHSETMKGLKPAPAIGSTVGESAGDKSDPRNLVLYGDAVARLASIPDNHVQCIITSPPFYNVRDYGTRSWFGGDPTCEHDQAIVHAPHHPGQVEQTKYQRVASGRGQTATTSSCSKCGAWYGQLGLEPTVNLYVSHLVAVFRESRRVLRDDGVLWVEIDDSYSGSGRGPTGISGRGNHSKRQGFKDGREMAGVTAPEMPAKNMVLVPERLILALQADGWTVRSKVVWAKTTCLGEHVRDRCTHAHSTIYMLTKNPRYYFDYVAIMEDSVTQQPRGSSGPKCKDKTRYGRFNAVYHVATNRYGVTKRYARDVWAMAPGRYKDAHTATFPETLPAKCIAASTSEKGACKLCGAPWVRVLHDPEPIGKAPSGTKYKSGSSSASRAAHPQAMRAKAKYERGDRFAGRPTLAHDVLPAPVTIGFEPACKCECADVVPCIVLDVFAGSGTTLAVAKKLGRDYLGTELNEGDYRELIEKRLAEAKSAVEKRRNVAAGDLTTIIRRANSDTKETPKTKRPRRRNG
jgi:DNA modification methylase